MQAIFRADAGGRIGSGHVMRSLALAQAWTAAGGRAVFATSGSSAVLEKHVRDAAIERVHLPTVPGSRQDAQQTALLARQRQADWIVLDGYHFGTAYQQVIHSSGTRLLVIDDTAHIGRYWAHVLLNQNIYASRGMYAQNSAVTTYLLGTRFALLRNEFFGKVRQRVASDCPARRVLVTMGGTDPDDVTSMVLDAIFTNEFKEVEVLIVIGGDNPHKEKIEKRTVGRRKPKVRVAQNTSRISDLMAWADVAVTAGGSTCWELAYMGVPAVVLVLADNQKEIAAGLASAGAMITLGDFKNASRAALSGTLKNLLENPDLRSRMRQQGSKLVDGKGCDRVVSALKAFNSHGHEEAFRCASCS